MHNINEKNNDMIYLQKKEKINGMIYQQNNNRKTNITNIKKQQPMTGTYKM